MPEIQTFTVVEDGRMYTESTFFLENGEMACEKFIRYLSPNIKVGIHCTLMLHHHGPCMNEFCEDGLLKSLS